MVSDNLDSRERVIHTSNKIRIADMFNVSYYGIPENVANILGKNTRSIDRLNVQFDSTKLRGRGGSISSHKDQVNFDPINILFHEDENGVVEGFIMSHIFRQNNRMTDLHDRENDLDRHYRFDIRVDMYNTAAVVTSSIVYKNCFFTSIAMQTVSYDDDSHCVISCTVDYDDVDILIVDEYINRKRNTYV